MNDMLATLEIEKTTVPQSRVTDVDFTNLKFGKEYSDHMFIADYSDGEWGKFRIEPYDLLHLSPSNTVLHYAQSVFEGMKAYKNPEGDVLLFRPFDNFLRLNISAKRMCIPELPEELFIGGLTELLRLDKDWVPDLPGTSLYVRPFIFATDEYIGIRPSDTYKFMIISSPAGGYYSEPLRVKIETEYTRACEGGTGFAKAAGNYAAALYPAKLAQEQGYHQLLWTDARDHRYIEEAGTMNVIFKIDGKLITSPTNNTILKGLTRDSVLTLARDWGLPVEERLVEVQEVIQAAREGRLEEAFGAGTAATVAPIDTIGFDGEDYHLPSVETWEFCNKAHQQLDDIKTGKAEDKHGWIYKV